MRKNILEGMPEAFKNMSTEDMKSTLMGALNNANIDPSMKQKLDSGDTEGLKSELINKLSSGDESNQRMAKMLKNNDMEGLKSQLMGMLMGGGEDGPKKKI